MAKEEMIKLKCECGTEFERPKIFQQYQKERPNVFYKWKLKYCDVCNKNRVNEALNHLPNIMKALSDSMEKQ